MAHKKAGGSTANVRDSNSQRLGVKLFGGQFCKTGNIIVRQNGSSFRAGKNVGTGKDYSLFALINGVVKFTTRKTKRFNGQLKIAQFVHVTPVETIPEKKNAAPRRTHRANTTKSKSRKVIREN